MPIAYVCEDLGKGIDTVSQSFRKLESDGFIAYCEATKWVWIKKFLKHNQLDNPKVSKGAIALINDVPKNAIFFNELCVEIRKIGKWDFPSEPRLSELLPKPIDTLSKGYRNIEIEIEMEIEKDDGGNAGARDPAHIIAQDFVDMRNELWPNDSRLTAPTITLRSQAKAYLDAGAPPDLVRDIMRTVMGKNHAKGIGPPTNLHFCKLSMETAIANHVTRPMQKGQENASAPGNHRRSSASLDDVRARDRAAMLAALAHELDA